MKKWYEEEYEFEITVTAFLRSDHTEHYCRNGEEIGDKYTCTYGCPVDEQGYGICSKMMQILYGDMQAVRSGWSIKDRDRKVSRTNLCKNSREEGHLMR